MKKLLLMSTLTGFVISLNAQTLKTENAVPVAPQRDMYLKTQQIVHPELQKSTLLENKEVRKIIHKDAVNYTNVGQHASGEYKFNDYEDIMNEYVNPIPLFPDSFARTSLYRVDYPDSSVSQTLMPAIGFVFDPYSSGYTPLKEQGLFKDETGIMFGYRIDTIILPVTYRIATYDANSRDTLRLYVSIHDAYKGTERDNQYLLWGFKEGTEYAGFRFATPLVEYENGIPQKGSTVVPNARTIDPIDYILDQSDDKGIPDEGKVLITYVSITEKLPLIVPAGSIVSILIKFIPGYAYDNNDTIRKRGYNKNTEKIVGDTICKNTLSMIAYNHEASIEYILDPGPGFNTHLMEDQNIRYQLGLSDTAWISNGKQAYNPYYYALPIVFMSLSKADYGDTMTNISETAATSVISKFYPNPASSQLTIDLKEAGQADVAIYNILGEVVLQQPVYNTHNVMDIATLSSGLYVVKVTQNGRTHTVKLSKK
jgi:hypothetical protein